MSAGSAARREHFETILAQVQAEYDEQLHRAARVLLSHGHARLDLPHATLDAHLLRFWRGDRILRIERTSGRHHRSAGSSITRFPRHDRPDGAKVLAHYLAVDLANARISE